MKIHQLAQRCAALILATSLLSPLAAQAADYPNKPVRIIVPTSAGGTIDAVARLYAENMSEFLGQPITVENRAGASTMLATRFVARAEPDGYTLLIGSNTVVTLPHVKDMGFSPDDLVGIGEFARGDFLLAVSSESSFESVSDLVEAAKQEPGTLTYPSAGQGSTSHVSTVMFARDAGIDLLHIPYKGTSLAVSDVLSGRVSLMIAPPGATAELIRSGKMRALATTSDSRSPVFPDVPTFEELGYADATYINVMGLLAPTGIPDSVRTKLGNALEAAKNDPVLLKRLKTMGQEVSDLRTPDQFEEYLRKSEDRFRQVIQESGIGAS